MLSAERPVVVDSTPIIAFAGLGPRTSILRMMGSFDDVLERLQEAGRLDLGESMRFEVQLGTEHPKGDERSPVRQRSE